MHAARASRGAEAAQSIGIELRRAEFPVPAAGSVQLNAAADRWRHGEESRVPSASGRTGAAQRGGGSSAAGMPPRSVQGRIHSGPQSFELRRSCHWHEQHCMTSSLTPVTLTPTSLTRISSDLLLTASCCERNCCLNSGPVVVNWHSSGMVPENHWYQGITGTPKGYSQKFV